MKSQVQALVRTVAIVFITTVALANNRIAVKTWILEGKEIMNEQFFLYKVSYVANCRAVSSMFWPYTVPFNIDISKINSSSYFHARTTPVHCYGDQKFFIFDFYRSSGVFSIVVAKHPFTAYKLMKHILTIGR